MKFIFIRFIYHVCVSKRETMLKREILDSRDRGSRNFIPERGINASNRNGFAYRLRKQILVVRISLFCFSPISILFLYSRIKGE